MILFSPLVQPRHKGEPGPHLLLNPRFGCALGVSLETDRVRAACMDFTGGHVTRHFPIAGDGIGTELDRIDEVLKLIGLTEQFRMEAGALSHGQKQWLEIGMLLMQNPRVLLVDEPVAGMTGEEVEHTAELLTSLAGKHSVIVVEHDMAFVRSIARKVTVLHQGSVLAEGTMDQVQNDPRVVEVYLGE